MGFDSKYGKVTTEYGDIPADEPVIVFRARDITTLDVLAYYLMCCASEGSPKRHLNIIIDTIEQFRTWQNDHPDQVRCPDSERSREWMDGDVDPAVPPCGFKKHAPDCRCSVNEESY